jgi:hypothetical protein
MVTVKAAGILKNGKRERLPYNTAHEAIRRYA